MLTSHQTNVPTSAVSLLAGVVDYAGLFPPAALDMGPAVAVYADALEGPDAWMLGRFVTPARRLPELREARGAAAASAPVWHVSAIAEEESDADWTAIAAFNAATADHRAVVDAVECRPQTLDGIDRLADRAGGLEVYVEVPSAAAPAVDPADWLARIARRGLRAKIRTGGTTAAAFPSPAAIVGFLSAALRAGVPFKATAGLHHAVRGSYRLTYASDAGEAPMYGYLNVLLATAALDTGASAAEAEQILLRTDAANLTFATDAIDWDGTTFPTSLLRRTRAEHLVGFGSCSFREPADEIRTLVTARG